MLVNKDDYLVAGIHIGMKTCTPGMKRFVYKIREDGLAVFNLKKVDERLAVAAKFLPKFSKIVVAGRKESASQPLQAFAKATGSTAFAGRFSPGTLTNPSYRQFLEPDLVVVADPAVDTQALLEAVKKRIPLVALCSTANTTRNIDLVLPVNNNGKKSLALIFWILAREYCKSNGKEFTMTLKDFGDDRPALPKPRAKALPDAAEAALEAEAQGAAPSAEATTPVPSSDEPPSAPDE